MQHSGHAPYRERGDAHVLARSHAIARYLVGQGVKALVVACNTATAAAIESLRAAHPDLPIIGVEPALKPAALLSRTRRIGVMATRGTLASAKFKLLRDALAPQAEFVLQPCDGLADAIERGIAAAAPEESATKIIASCTHHTMAMGRFGLKDGEIDTLVLGCTHYPFASEALRVLLGADVYFIATGEAVARQTRRLVQAKQADQAFPAAAGQLKLLTTGQPHLLQAATACWLRLACSAHPLTL